MSKFSLASASLCVSLLLPLAAHAEVFQQDYVDSRVTLHCRIPRRFMNSLPGLNSLPGEDTHVHLTNGNGADVPELPPLARGGRGG